MRADSKKAQMLNFDRLVENQKLPVRHNRFAYGR